VSVPSSARLSSRQHAVVRRFRQIARGGDPDVVLIDGEHLLAEALACGVPIEIVLTDGRAPGVVGRARAAGATVHEAAAAVIEAASPVRTPTGVVALAHWQPAALAGVLARPDGPVLGLVGVQDPGNVGSAIRAADALGAGAVVALDGTADPRGWKTMRGAMGSTFRVPVARGQAPEAIDQAKRSGLTVVASVAAGGTPLEQAGLSMPVLLLVGSEGAGLPPEIVSMADQRVTVPMRSGVDSLNVAVTAALLLFEARRQRQSAANPL
jgi:RNA methyltransferase, TrmH family